MENELNSLHLLSLCSSNQIGTAHPKWLAENIEGVNQSVKRMLEIIQQVEDSTEEKTEIYCQTRPELISLIQDINKKHQFLAERFDHLVDELHGNVSPALQIQKPGSALFHTCRDNPFLTPDQKQGRHKIEQQAIAFDLPLTSGSSSSNVSAKEGSESSSSSDSDSECHHSSPYNPSNLKKKDSEEMLSKLETEENISKVADNLEYGEELRILEQKLQFSEDEIARLKGELESKIPVANDNLKAELERAIAEEKVHEDDFELEKKKVLELQMQIAGLEAKLADSGCKVEILLKELKSTTEKLDISERELAKSKQEMQSELQLSKRDTALLKANLASEEMQVFELQEKITRYTEDVSDRDCEIRKLTTALQEASINSEVEKAQLQSHQSSLLEKLALLEARCAEREVQIKLLENEIKRCEASKIEMKAIYEAQEIIWQEDIERFKVYLNEKCKEIEYLNKNYDGHKLRYDMLMAEKDGLIAKIQTLNAELLCRDIRIQQQEAELHQLKLQHAETPTTCENALKLREDLRLKVEELEKEVERQAAIISDRAEEKREAIRQLCISLEHYRSGYQELREAYRGQRRHAVIAS